MRKLKLRKVKQLAQGHKAIIWQTKTRSKDSKGPISSTPPITSAGPWNALQRVEKTSQDSELAAWHTMARHGPQIPSHRAAPGTEDRVPGSAKVPTSSGLAHWAPAGAAMGCRPHPAQSRTDREKPAVSSSTSHPKVTERYATLCGTYWWEAGGTDHSSRLHHSSRLPASVSCTAGVGHRVVGLLEQNVNLNLQLLIQSKPQNC